MLLIKKTEGQASADDSICCHAAPAHCLLPTPPLPIAAQSPRTSSTSTASSAMLGGLPRCCFCISAAARLMPAELTASVKPATAARRCASLAAAATASAAALLVGCGRGAAAAAGSSVAAGAELELLLALGAAASLTSTGAACKPERRQDTGGKHRAACRLSTTAKLACTVIQQPYLEQPTCEENQRRSARAAAAPPAATACKWAPDSARACDLIRRCIEM